MIKKTKLIAGIALIIQSLTFLILFFVFYSRKKKSANAYLGISLAAALSGAALIVWHKESEKAEERLLWGSDWEDCEDLFDDTLDGDIDCVIEDNEDGIENADSTSDVLAEEI